MKLTVHDDAAAFLRAAAPLLARDEAENSMIALSAARRAGTPRDDGLADYMATVADGATVVTAAYHSPPGGVLLTGGPADATGLVAYDMARLRCDLRGMVGPLAACEAFARVWTRTREASHRLHVHLRHLAMWQPPAAVDAAGAMRLPLPAEHERIADWQVAFGAEANVPELPARHRDNAARRLRAGETRVWDDGGMVAYAAYGSNGDIARIAPVYTAPDRRGRGYASALVAGLARELFAGGRRGVFITTDAGNPVSNRIYERIGFRFVADHYHFHFVAAGS